MSLSEQDHDAGTSPDWLAVWRAVGVSLRDQRRRGFGHLLTEGTLRHDVVLALVDSGVEPRRLAVEWPAKVLRGGKVDLVLDPPAGAAVELKYPRGSRTPISPDTMTLGEMLRDFLRVSMLAVAEAWVVQVVDSRLRGYLERVESRHPLQWSFTEGRDLVVDPLTVAGLPRTATVAVGGLVVPAPVVATCAVADEVDDTLGLYAYRVHSGASAGGQAASSPGEQRDSVSAPTGDLPVGARATIMDAVRRLRARTGSDVFTIAEVVEALRVAGSPYATSTIRTMISSHLGAESQGDGIAPYADVHRVGRGLYRLSS